MEEEIDISLERLTQYDNDIVHTQLGINNFSSASNYAVNDLVRYDGIIYRFISAHTAGAWDSSQVVATTIVDEIETFCRNLQDGEGEGSVKGKVGSNTASNSNSFAFGRNAVASGYVSYAVGYDVTASASQAHAEGNMTTASGGASHAEGEGTLASAVEAHAEGYDTTASGAHAHAEGYNTTASGINSHTEGNGTKALNANEHASGIYNNSIEADSTNNIPGTLFTIGNGTADNARKNALQIDKDNKVYIRDSNDNQRDLQSLFIVKQAIDFGSGTNNIYTLLASEPSDFSTNYNNYYKLVSGVYQFLTSAETFASDTYYEITTINGSNTLTFTLDANKYYKISNLPRVTIFKTPQNYDDCDEFMLRYTLYSASQSVSYSATSGGNHTSLAVAGSLWSEANANYQVNIIDGVLSAIIY